MLGPVLFLIFINDVNIGVNRLFTDELKMIGNGRCRTVTQTDLDTICSWARARDLPFNEPTHSPSPTCGPTGADRHRWHVA